MIAIGIDVGGTSIKAGLVNEAGEILIKDACPTLPKRGAQAVIDDMAALCRKIVRDAGTKLDDVAFVGVGIPGIEDAARGIVPFCTNLYWHEVPLRSMLSARLADKRVIIHNDAVVAALAESVAGASRGTKNSVLVTLGTGVGGGVMINGLPFVGAHGVATEIGHMVIEFDGVPCSCGTRGCWERYASATALIRVGQEEVEKNPRGALSRIVDGDAERVTAKAVIDCAKAGDPSAVRIFDEYVFWVCVGLRNLINTYDPEVFLLGGGVSEAGEFLLDAVRAKLPELVFFKSMPFARVELAALRNDAGIIGAAMLGHVGL